MAVPPRTLFAGLVGDAALFPPGNAPMDVGVRQHAEHRRSWYADLVGPFLCPTSRVDELERELGEEVLAVSLVVDDTGEQSHSALRAVAGDDRLQLRAVEAAAARLGDDAAQIGRNVRRLPDVTGFLEVPRRDFEAALRLVGDEGWSAAKYRTGGTTADAFPDEAELAAFLVAAADAGTPFKLTAGLHHALRHTATGTGFEHHGLLNVLVATSEALDGGSRDDVAAVLGKRESTPLVERATAWSEADVQRVRGSFRSVGCCGVTDPIHGLVELGLIEETS